MRGRDFPDMKYANKGTRPIRTKKGKKYQVREKWVTSMTEFFFPGTYRKKGK